MLYIIVIVFSSREGTVAVSVLPVVRTAREVVHSVAYHCLKRVIVIAANQTLGAVWTQFALKR